MVRPGMPGMPNFKEMFLSVLEVARKGALGYFLMQRPKSGITTKGPPPSDTNHQFEKNSSLGGCLGSVGVGSGSVGIDCC